MLTKTRDGLIGDYDYAFLFKPNLPFMKKSKRAAPFFGLNDKMPFLLALLLGFQHALSMLAGIITPPIIIAGQGGAALGPDNTQYLVSTALIVCGILSSIQITRFRIYKYPYYIGTGLISVVGTSFSIIPVTTGAFSQMYATGYCPSAADGTKLPCPKGYGALLGTACLCSLLEIGLSFTKPSVLKKVFPPLVTGPTVMLIGISLIESGFQNWSGGAGSPGCIDRPDSGPYSVCPRLGAPHALPWGSAEYIGLGFSVFATIILCERFGSPIMKSCAVIVGLLIGCIIAGATGYFSHSGIDAAPAASFIWVKTFPLSIYGPIILPLMAVYIVLMMEAIGDITATCDVSRLEVEGKLFDSHIQGGVLADGFNGLIAGLCTITPVSTYVPIFIPSSWYPAHTTTLALKLHPPSSCPHCIDKNENTPANPIRQFQIRPEQRCNRANTLCQPQSRLRRLLLSHRHGNLLEIRRRPRRHPRARTRRPHHLPLQLGRRLRNPHHFHRPLHSAESIYIDGGIEFGVWGDFGAELVCLCFYLSWGESV